MTHEDDNGSVNLGGVAAELWVDGDTIDARRVRLHSAEKSYIKRRLRAREGAA